MAVSLRRAQGPGARRRRTHLLLRRLHARGGAARTGDAHATPSNQLFRNHWAKRREPASGSLHVTLLRVRPRAEYTGA